MFLVDANVLSEATKPLATALVHGIPLTTLNRRDFDKAGVEIIDPFA